MKKMAEKLYETLAKEALVIIHQHREEAKKIGDAVQKLNADTRYSDFGKEELIKKLREELNTLNKDKTKELKAVVQRFVSEYQTVHTDDGNASSQDVGNALKIIDMCGFGITPDVLRSAIEPIKTSYTALKMIHSIFEAKSNAVMGTGVGYRSDVLTLMDEYIGVNAEIITYEEVFASVKELLDMSELVSAGIHGEPNYGGSVINYLLDSTPYCTLCLSDNMVKVGKLYDVVYLKYPRLFK